ncbi:MAG: hypothetical protein M9962_04185 [Oligoflexia bacterium]|nr:hypothetical protein [Oligoflexia bacterium]
MTILLSLILSLSQFSNATVIQSEATSVLNRFYIDDSLPYQEKDIISGTVIVNKSKRYILLELSLRPTCPVGRVCAAIMPELRIVKLPITKIGRSMCNTDVYMAQPRRYNKSLYETLTVVDNTNNKCPTFAPLSPTEVSYETYSGDNLEIKTFSKFEGSRLE